MSSDRALCAGRYRLERPLGRGPSGVVYSATDLETGRPCALKRLHAQFYDEAALTELQRDALLQLQLAHPAIVAPLATGFDEDGGFFLVTELVEGEPLRARLQRGPLSPRETLEVLAPLCAALEAAHGVGLHHGDLSPANVLCPPGAAARLCDFGMHRLGAAADARWGGPPGYVPPEVYRGEAPTASAAGDVFALGAMLFECLTGERLFTAPSASAVMFKICVAPLPVLPATVQGDRERLEALIAMACSKDPAGRFEHAGALLRAMRVVLVEEPARTPTAPMSSLAAPPAAQLAPLRPALPAMPALRLPHAAAAAPADLGPEDEEPLPPAPRFGVIAGWASAGGLAMAMLLLLVRARPAERPAPTPVAVAPAPTPPPTEPPAPLTAARLLAAEERYAAQDYIAALAAAEELLRAQPDDPALRDLQRRAREALRLQAVYQGFLRAAERGETDVAVALYRELPQGSAARALAQPRFAAVRARFEQHHLAVAAAALDRGVCDEVQRQADEILLVAESADDAAAVQGRRLAARCRGQSPAPSQRPALERSVASPAPAPRPTADAERPAASPPTANTARPPALAAADARRRAAPAAGALRGGLKDPFRDGKR